jgi:hypothetical protein
MKTKFTETVSPATTTYPCLRRHQTGGFVVLFINAERGIVVESSLESRPVNFSETKWVNANDKSKWTKVTGTVTFEID